MHNRQDKNIAFYDFEEQVVPKPLDDGPAFFAKHFWKEKGVLLQEFNHFGEFCQ